jgi:hypothetical protein
MSNRRTFATLGLEAAGFGLVILLIWADEFLDLPHVIFGAPPTPIRYSELLLEGGATFLLGLVVVVMSWRTNQRVTELELLVMICASCRRVSVDGDWLTFEDFIRERERIMTSHGVCPTCYAREMQSIGEYPEPLRP